MWVPRVLVAKLDSMSPSTFWRSLTMHPALLTRMLKGLFELRKSVANLKTCLGCDMSTMCKKTFCQKQTHKSIKIGSNLSPVNFGSSSSPGFSIARLSPFERSLLFPCYDTPCERWLLVWQLIKPNNIGQYFESQDYFQTRWLHTFQSSDLANARICSRHHYHALWQVHFQIFGIKQLASRLESSFGILHHTWKSKIWSSRRPKPTLNWPLQLTFGEPDQIAVDWHVWIGVLSNEKSETNT